MSPLTSSLGFIIQTLSSSVFASISLVLDFLVCAMQSGNNMYVGTMKKIAVNINSSKATVQRAMDSLADKGFVAMQLDGVWLINPSMESREIVVKKRY